MRTNLSIVSRVMRLLGSDQGTVTILDKIRNSLALVIDARFIDEGKNLIWMGHAKLLWLVTGRIGVRSPGDKLHC